VGILNTNPSHALDVTQTGATSARVGGTGGSGANDGTVIINNGGTGDAMLRFDYETNTDRARIGTSTSNQQLEFYTAGDNQRMRILSGGRVHIGDATNSDAFADLSSSGNILVAGIGAGFGDNAHVYNVGGFTGPYDLVVFRNGNGVVGTITINGSTTTYAPSSDYRLKENVAPISDGITRLKQLKPSRFNFIADGPDKKVDGFLAHEAQAVVPEAVTGTKDELEVWKEHEELPDGVSVGDNKLDDDGNTIPKMQGVDQSKLVPLLTAALQEAIAKIEALETENTSIKARLDALEAE
jgi:hypothetical protein